LDDDMHVIALHGEVQHPKPLLRGLADAPSNLEKQHLLPQARQSPSCPKRDVHRMPPLVLRPRAMRHSHPPSRCLSPSPQTPSSPRPSERQLELNVLSTVPSTFSRATASAGDDLCHL